MPRPANATQKAEIRRRYAELCAQHPMGGVNLKKMLSEEFGVPVRTVLYYLKDAVDARQRYTEKERAFLRTASYTECVEWAKINGRNPSAVYAVAHRMQVRALKGETGERPAKMVALEAQGFLDFGSRKDLMAAGFTPTDFRVAKNLILDRFKLSLISPNCLCQKEKSRHIALSLGEQIALLKTPVDFLKRLAATQNVASRWVSTQEMEYVVTLQTPSLDPDAPAPVRLVAFKSPYHENAARALRALHKHVPVFTPEIHSAPVGKFVLGGRFTPPK